MQFDCGSQRKSPCLAEHLELELSFFNSHLAATESYKLQSLMTRKLGKQSMLVLPIHSLPRYSDRLGELVKMGSASDELQMGYIGKEHFPLNDVGIYCDSLSLHIRTAISSERFEFELVSRILRLSVK